MITHFRFVLVSLRPVLDLVLKLLLCWGFEVVGMRRVYVVDVGEVGRLRVLLTRSQIHSALPLNLWRRARPIAAGLAFPPQCRKAQSRRESPDNQPKETDAGQGPFQGLCV